jgi:ABC-2 type transport system ATP-binding protein
LTRSFGKVKAVENLNLKVPAGSLFGLIGPNGAGKTTTLRMLAGLLEPTSGEIRINGLATRKYWKEVQWQIGFMPDFFGVYEDLLVWEYLDFFARCYKIPAARRRKVTEELLQLVDLDGKHDAYVHTLSRGMRQRLCLAHALVHDPQLLLLDEPASGLDPRARVEMRELLRELQSMGKTILLSSHILSELSELCDSIAIIERGRLVTSGPLSELHRRANQHRTIQVHFLSDPVQAETILASSPKVKRISCVKENGRGNLLEIEFLGDDEAAADLLESLVAQRVRIASFEEVNLDLEETFLKLTKGEVA